MRGYTERHIIESSLHGSLSPEWFELVFRGFVCGVAAQGLPNGQRARAVEVGGSIYELADSGGQRPTGVIIMDEISQES